MLILDCYSSPGIVLLQMTHMTDVFYQYRFQVIFWQCVFKDHSQNHTLTSFPSALCACGALGLCVCALHESFKTIQAKVLGSSLHFYWTKHKFGLLQFSSGTKWTIKIRPIQLCHAILCFFFPWKVRFSLAFQFYTWCTKKMYMQLHLKTKSCAALFCCLLLLLRIGFWQWWFCLFVFALSFHNIVAITKGY